MVPLVVLASGRGSNFQAIVRAIQKNALSAKILAVISDQPKAFVLSAATSAGIEAISVPFLKHPNFSQEANRLEHESRLLVILKKIKPQFLILAGYQRILTASFIETFRCPAGYARIVNIHPSLLPAFCGMNAYAQAYHYGVQFTGITIHLVEAGVDTGPICAQEIFSIVNCHSVAEVEKKGLKIEHRLFAQTLRWILPEKFTLERRLEGRICVRQS